MTLSVRRWQVTRVGEPADVLSLTDGPGERQPDGHVRVAVRAAALNFPDLLYCRGQYQVRPEPPFTPGLEVAGTVIETSGGDRLPVGQAVAAATVPPAGGFSEEVVVPFSDVFAVDDSVESEVAATFLITYQTAHVSLHRRARLEAGETVVVHGGAGGVGSATIQLARAADARVVATAGGAEKVRICAELGADHSIDYLAEDVTERVKEVTDGKGADVIIDPVGGEVFDASRRCVAREGRIVIIGFTSGGIPTVRANHVLLKNYAVMGMHWDLYRRTGPQVLHDAHRDIRFLYRSGDVRPLISEVFDFTELPAAMEHLDDRSSWGKVVLRS